jgi:ribosome-associated toxin RatA of RatAB toxin-antitoxin module
MATASLSEVFDCSVEQIYKLISSYEDYPKFLPEVKQTKILEIRDNKKLVSYTISLIKSFTYELWMSETAPHTILWDFNKGDLFKKMSGSWKIQEEAGKARATYTIDAQFNLFVPGPIAKALIQVNLPNMMSSYKKRVSEVYG